MEKHINKSMEQLTVFFANNSVYCHIITMMQFEILHYISWNISENHTCPEITLDQHKRMTAVLMFPYLNY